VRRAGARPQPLRRRRTRRFVTRGFGAVAALWIGLPPVPASRAAHEIQREAPSAPRNLSASAVSASEIDLAWSPPDHPKGLGHYNVYRDNVLVATVPVGTTIFKDTRLQPATKYHYYVTGVDLIGSEGPASNKVDATTLTDVPGPPKNLAAQAASSSEIDLTWDAPTSGAGAAHYEVYRDGSDIGATTSTSYADEGLSPSTTHSYVVTAVSSAGKESSPSNQASATTLTDVPGAPQHLKAQAASSSEIDLTWNPPSSGAAADHYIVYRNGGPVAQSASTSYADRGLPAATSFEYVVTAVSADGKEGPESNKATATTEPGPPGPPQNLTAQAASSSRIDLAWDPPIGGSTGIDHYDVYRDGSKIDSTGSTLYADMALEPATKYTYAVSAVGLLGLESPRSAEASATTAKGPDTSPPTAPTALQAKATGMSTVQLTWSAASDPESGIASYVIYRDGNRVGQVDGLSFTDGGLKPSSQYSYRVSAINGAKLEGPRSDPATVTTGADKLPPSPPTDLHVIPSGS